MVFEHDNKKEKIEVATDLINENIKFTVKGDYIYINDVLDKEELIKLANKCRKIEFQENMLVILLN